MLSRLQFWKPGPRPSLSYLLVLTCLVVSLPVYFSPRLYNVLGGVPRFYPWQFLTSVFAHGSYLGPVPLLLHLATNVALFLLIGAPIERLVGTSRFALLSATALTLHMLLRVVTGGWGNGASAITWAYTPFALYLLVAAWKAERERLRRDPAANHRPAGPTAVCRA